jgi:hypothetical protein
MVIPVVYDLLDDAPGWRGPRAGARRRMRRRRAAWLAAAVRPPGGRRDADSRRD